MATSQHFTFRPPDRQGLTVLHVEEAPSAFGSWIEIDAATDVGAYPDYITEYSTNNAFDATNWFRIRWSDGKGAYTAYSEPLKGNSTTLVGEIVKRARERDRTIDVGIYTQEAEAAIQMYYGEDVDPYDTTLRASYKVLNGLTYLVMANAKLTVELAGSGQIESASLGLVSFKTSQSSTGSRKAIEELIALANKNLGISTSFVMQMNEILPRRRMLLSYDQSRLSGFVGFE